LAKSEYKSVITGIPETYSLSLSLSSADLESEEELEPFYFPEVPNPILCGLYTPKDTIWLFVAGCDAGYMYEYEINKEEPISCTMIAEADDNGIYSYLYK
jgi:hypothetical protein